MIAQIVYLLCGLTSILCAVLLFRQYRLSGTALLFWSTGCFVFLALTNIVLFVDLVMIPSMDFSIARNVLSLAAMLMLLHGLIRERS